MDHWRIWNKKLRNRFFYVWYKHIDAIFYTNHDRSLTCFWTHRFSWIKDCSSRNWHWNRTTGFKSFCRALIKEILMLFYSKFLGILSIIVGVWFIICSRKTLEIYSKKYDMIDRYGKLGKFLSYRKKTGEIISRPPLYHYRILGVVLILIGTMITIKSFT